MKDDSPSRTAQLVAVSRAAHQLFDRPRIFEDPLALSIIGPEAAAGIRAAARRFNLSYSRFMRAYLVARSRLAEDALSEAVSRGVRQYVVLGAGLDTFAHRNPHAAAGLRVFEVDHPATQEWKRQLLSRADLTAPQSLTYVSLNFENQRLTDRLAANGFHGAEPAFFSWLGVTMYLSQDAIQETLKFVARSPTPSGIIFDYLTRPQRWQLLRRLGLKLLTNRMAATGEPWRTFFDPAQLYPQLMNLGFTSIKDFGADEINARLFTDAGARLRVGEIGRVVLAGV